MSSAVRYRLVADLDCLRWRPAPGMCPREGRNCISATSVWALRSSSCTGVPTSITTTCCPNSTGWPSDSGIIYYDQRGRGRSADGVRPEEVSLESEMDDLDHVRRYFGLDSMALLGHSWGGVLAMEYASRHPERLTHLILMNTAPASNRDINAWRQHMDRTRPAGDVAAMQFLSGTAEFRAGTVDVESEYYRIHYRPAFYAPALLDRLIPRLRANFTPERVLVARAIEHRLYDETWSSPGYDLHPRLRHVAVPALVIHGENDFVPVDVAAQVARAMPKARLVVLSRCGHFATWRPPTP